MMTTLDRVAEYMYANDVAFIEKCDEREYIDEYVFIEFQVVNGGVVFMDAEFTNDLPVLHDNMFAINVSDVVDHRVDILDKLEVLTNA